MQKEELLHLHMLMVQIKKYYEFVSNKSVPTEEYDALSISPMHIHKNKNLHRTALLTLGNEIVSQMKATMPKETTSAVSSETWAEVPAEH
ncbi:MAG TPA: UPF0058 family protein [Methanocorpusculum sp.]|nr:UPF0058 family protein [Methanocorpusculum sp.]HJJ40175.1 UPF0058 family protein [Methanocorpusculum sp.]HJJ49564.1 UPF0058 family protein [Methanocorpusculum sp.]HJJ57649.1 UPF0058 family protein [Methanocorpusculum sp.]HJJ95165.1 UPF0058 family protein [Methanocorpusculum sp.]